MDYLANELNAYNKQGIYFPGTYFLHSGFTDEELTAYNRSPFTPTNYQLFTCLFHEWVHHLQSVSTSFGIYCSIMRRLQSIEIRQAFRTLFNNSSVASNPTISLRKLIDLYAIFMHNSDWLNQGRDDCPDVDVSHHSRALFSKNDGETAFADQLYRADFIGAMIDSFFLRKQKNSGMQYKWPPNHSLPAHKISPATVIKEKKSPLQLPRFWKAMH